MTDTYTAINPATAKNEIAKPHTVKDNIRNNVNNPPHYTQHKYTVIQLTRMLPNDAGNIVKYIVRAPYKKGIEDLQKAIWYAKDQALQPCAYLEVTYQQWSTKYEPILVEFVKQVRGYDIPQRNAFADLLYFAVCHSIGMNIRWAKDDMTCAARLSKYISIIENDEHYKAMVNEYQSTSC